MRHVTPTGVGAEGRKGSRAEMDGLDAGCLTDSEPPPATFPGGVSITMSRLLPSCEEECSHLRKKNGAEATLAPSVTGPDTCSRLPVLSHWPSVDKQGQDFPAISATVPQGS